jgi:small subunit ribosomal protein S3
MIERKFIADKLKEFRIQEFVSDTVKRVGHSHTKVQKTPLGEKIIIYTSRPGLIVGRKGQNIKKVTSALKKRFSLENPQLEISEVESPFLDAQIVAENIANSLERFGIARFKGVGHKMMQQVMDAGARGIEIVVSGKVPSSRAKVWRFYQGYLKKCGDIAVSGVRKAIVPAEIKTGTIGIQVRIMPPDIRLPDDIRLIKNESPKEDSEEKKKDADAPAKKEEKPKKKTVKKASKPKISEAAKEAVKEEEKSDEPAEKPEAETQSENTPAEKEE